MKTQTKVVATALLLLATGRAPAISNTESSSNAPSVAVILERALEQAKKEDAQEQAFKRTYFFNRSRVTEFKNSKGEVKKHEEKSSRHDPLRVLASDAKKAAAAPKLVQVNSAGKSVSETETNIKGRAFEKSDFPLDSDLLSRFEFTFVKRETINGRSAFVLDFKPVNPPVPDRSFKDKFINKAAGRVWVDEEDAAVAKADLFLTRRVNVMGGMVGAVWKFTCTMERDRTPEGYWYIRNSNWHLEGREVFVQRVVDSQEKRSDLQRAQVTTPRVDGEH